ncbi:MAG TPA: tetratricopeptide repeat protein, partial [Gammaproteobacteria bacterium]|nr:tetratricopeptide repeat protein [Gammaproteobacteria bacterium]
MSVKSLKILGLCSALFIPATAPYAASSQNKDIAQLLVQGHFWYSRGRADLTEKAWKKVLLAEPNNIEALSGLEELSHYNPEDIDRNKLRLARELARQHRYEEALTAYQDAFRGKPPTSFYTAEYFETLSGTQNGWLTALEGLQELTATYPSNPRYQLALGRVNTYREKTRHTGIEQLASVAVEPGINEKIQQAAIDSWRDALLWLPNDPASKSQMKAFLEVVPDDPAVLQKIALAPAGIPAGNSEAYAILEQGKLSQAARLFKKVLKSQPDNADALAGLGITRFRQRRFASAARKLQQALKRAPGKQQDLQPLLNDARYWAKYRRAEKARKNGEYAKAERLGQALLNLRPTQVEGQLLRARIFAEQGQFYQAADAYQQILESHPRNTQAKRGLVDALIKEDPAQALALVSQYGLSEVDYQKERDKLDATRLQEQSKAETDPAVALTLLEKAHQLTPHDPWITLDLARRYQAANRQHEAHALLDTLVSNNPGDRDARYAKAIFHTEAKEWQSGLQAITKIPATLRTPDQQRLEQRLWGLSQRQQAATLMAAGADDEALLIAKSMRERSEENPELGLLYADLLLDLGQTEAGIAAADNAMDLLSSADANLNIQYASLLLKSRQLAKLKAQLLELKFNDTLD